jgi:phosphoribosylaminoimidazolecarboxamide formyltransferase / IMP cyclohydrolase
VKPLAFVSVSDKRGVEAFAGGLVALGWEVASTGGTARALRAAGVPVTEVSELTAWPEGFSGRVKTLHPRVFGGILADLDEPEHRASLAEWNARAIGIVAVNLYPFVQTASRDGATAAEVIENIDIGGPSLLRAGAKNHKHVAVVVDPDDYDRVLAALQDGEIPLATRRQLALKAFRHTAGYDLAISAMLPRFLDTEPELALATLSPWLAGEVTPLRYGENPHQRAVLLRHRGASGLAGYQQLQGKELSYNNLVDADGAWRLVHDLPGGGVAIVKHASPCGVALGDTVAAAYSRALACDPVSAFGGVIASSRPCDGEAARKITEIFAEVVVLPEADGEARAVLATKKNLRVLLAPPPMSGVSRIRAIDGGLLIQSPDEGWDEEHWRVVTQRQPSGTELLALNLAWRVAKHATSNAIVVADRDGTVGIGAGQPSRVDSCRIALERARSFGLATAGTAAGSDAFFPFPDGVETLAAGGVTAIAQPGGSVRDGEVIAAADRLGLAMVFTGRRHFRH